MYPKDPSYLKLLVSAVSFGALLDTKASPQVAAVLTFDTVHQMLITHTSASAKSSLTLFMANRFQVYTYMITNFANPQELVKVVWSVQRKVPVAVR